MGTESVVTDVGDKCKGTGNTSQGFGPGSVPKTSFYLLWCAQGEGGQRMPKNPAHLLIT